jgi:hypothetical protein
MPNRLPVASHQIHRLSATIRDLLDCTPKGLTKIAVEVRKTS